MTCDDVTREAIDLLAYGEAAADRAALEAHLDACATCRTALADLQAIRQGIEARGTVEAPRGGDWTAFMAALDTRLDAVDRARGRWRTVRAGVLALAATLVVGIALGAWWEHTRRAAAPEPIAVSGGAPPAVVTQEVAVASVGATHLERSKLVLLGLLSKDANAPDADWTYERKVAGDLLPDTSLYRLAAERQHLAGLARVLKDLELVLLQTSLSDEGEAGTLARAQRVIRNRDLLTRIDTLSDRDAAPTRTAGGA